MRTRRTTAITRLSPQRAAETRPASETMPTKQRVTQKALPRYLQKAAGDRGGGSDRASDPAECEARSVAAAVARSPAESVTESAPKRTAPDALPDPVREPMEAAFGDDFSRVRIRTDAAAGASARALHARAFTAGDAIAFAPGEYQPDTARGRELIAHELTHVVQQRQAGPGGAPVVQCEGDGQGTVSFGTPTIVGPTAIAGDAAEQARWRRLVDRAVRARYGIRGAAISGAQVDFVGEAEFARRFPAGSMEEVLLNLFIAHGLRRTGVISAILATAQHPFHTAGAQAFFDWTPELRVFIREGMARNFFEVQTRERDVRTGQPFPPTRIPPRDLIAQHIAGATDIAPDRRRQRSILMQTGAYVDTLTHEVCHFYISNAFRDMAQGRADGGEFLRGAHISQILIEGFAEHFAQQVMEANEATLGPSTGVSYPAEVRVVGDLVQTLDEATVRAAYFDGNAAAIARVSAAIDVYKDTHPDLLVPGLPVSAPPPSATPPRTPPTR